MNNVRVVNGIETVDSQHLTTFTDSERLSNFFCLFDDHQVVYVARNPKDVIVSYFHYHKLIHFHQFTGDLESFADYFMSDKGMLYLL